MLNAQHLYDWQHLWLLQWWCCSQILLFFIMSYSDAQSCTFLTCMMSSLAYWFTGSWSSAVLALLLLSFIGSELTAPCNPLFHVARLALQLHLILNREILVMLFVFLQLWSFEAFDIYQDRLLSVKLLATSFLTASTCVFFILL